jgi:hypothetical protein
MKIPKNTDHNSVKCPRCGKVHKIPLELLSAAAIALNQNAAKKINSAAGFGNK